MSDGWLMTVMCAATFVAAARCTRARSPGAADRMLKRVPIGMASPDWL